MKKTIIVSILTLSVLFCIVIYYIFAIYPEKYLSDCLQNDKVFLTTLYDSGLEELDTLTLSDTEKERVLNCIDGYKNAIKYIDAYKPPLKPFLFNAVWLKTSREGEVIGNEILLTWIEDGFDVIGISLYLPESDSPVVKLPVFRGEIFRDKETRKECKGRVIRGHNVPVVFGNRWAFDNSADSIEVEIPGNVSPENIKISIYDIHGNESNKMALFKDCRNIPNLGDGVN